MGAMRVAGVRGRLGGASGADEEERSDGAEQSPKKEMKEAQTMDEGAADRLARVGFAPIVRVDAARREIELCATSEAVDSHGTIFDYEASKDAFTRWVGNVREMHGRYAVGRRVAVRCDDTSRRIFVRIRVSRGAQDTWEKVRDGTLCGASIGASGVVWQRQQRRIAGEQRAVQVATRYDLVELSLVDNPSNPDALGISFVRDAAPDVALLDVLDDHEDHEEGNYHEERDVLSESSERKESRDDRDPAREASQPIHERLHGAARAVLSGCGCALCQAAAALMDEPPATAERALETERPVQEAPQPLARALAAGLTENSARIVALDAGVRALAATIETSLQRMADGIGGLHRRVESLESQPQTGGPAARPVAKPSAFAQRRLPGTASAQERYEALESLAGSVADPQVQVAIAAELIRLQQQGE